MKQKLLQKKTYRFIVVTFLILTTVFLLFQIRHLYPLYQYGWIGTLDFIEYWSAGQLFIEGMNPYDQSDPQRKESDRCYDRYRDILVKSF